MHCLITAGPTREYLDPVRFLSNGSSGKMGFALAAAARQRSWTVDLVSGPVSLSTPPGVNRIDVVSADQMYAACAERFTGCDLFIAVAAVADFRPAQRQAEKSRKPAGPMQLDLVPTIDILATLAAGKSAGQCVVGFAAETVNVVEAARQKLQAKHCDWIVANDVGRPGIGMDADNNAIVLISRAQRVHSFGPAPKADVARFILDQIIPPGSS